MTLFKNKPEPIYRPNKNLYSSWQNKYYKFLQLKLDIKWYAKKILKWICFLGILIFGIVMLSVYIKQSSTMPKNDVQEGMLGANIFTKWIVYPMEDLLWMLMFVFGWICQACGQIFVKIGGSGLLDAVTKNDAVQTFLISFTSVAVIFFAVMLLVRGAKIAMDNDSDIAHEKGKQTVGIAFWCISFFVLMPIIFWFVMAIFDDLVMATVDQTDGGIAWQIFCRCCIDGDVATQGSKITDWNSLSYYWDQGHKLIDKDCFRELVGNTDIKFNPWLCFLAWIGGTVLMGMFAWTAISIIFNMLYLYICIFIAVGKWPQDEGASAEEVRNELVGNMINLFALYFCFQIVMLVITATDGIAAQIMNDGFGKAILHLVLLFAALWTGYNFAYRGGQFFVATPRIGHITGTQLLNKGQAIKDSNIGQTGIAYAKAAPAQFKQHAANSLENKRSMAAKSAYHSALAETGSKGAALQASKKASGQAISSASKFSQNSWSAAKKDGFKQTSWGERAKGIKKGDKK